MGTAMAAAMGTTIAAAMEMEMKIARWQCNGDGNCDKVGLRMFFCDGLFASICFLPHRCLGPFRSVSI
jgi:hypothetical protein